MAVHFVLDHNFPRYVTRFPWPPEIVLSPLAKHAPDLVRDVEDWIVLIELSKRGGVDGFITNDAGILLLPPEMVALRHTRLALVVTEGVGDEPIRATGLVMVHLEEIVKRLDGTPWTFTIRPNRGIEQSTPDRQINRIAQFRNVLPPDIIRTELPRIQQRIAE